MDIKIDFTDILMSTLHDTKNSLGLLFNTTEEIIDSYEDQNNPLYHRFHTLQYEIKRLNHSLIRLLTLYKSEKSNLLIHVDYYSVCDLIEDIVLQNEHLFSSRGIEIEMECPEDLFWIFDKNLVGGVLDNVLNNAFRYTRNRVKISANKEDNGYLAIRIEDDGTGYPENMLIYDKEHPQYKKITSFDTGSTGLGLYFSLMIAKLHTNEDRKGYITMDNGGKYGGGVFTIFIP